MPNTITPADLLLAPAPSVVVMTTDTDKGTRKAADKPTASTVAVMPNGPALAGLHTAATAAGEVRAVFGLTADRVAAVSVKLTVCHRVAGNGRLGNAELTAVSPMLGDATAARLRAIDGRSVVAGRTVGAPTAGDQYATRAASVVLVGAGLDKPTTVALSPAGERAFRTGETASIVMLAGNGSATVFALSVSVRVMRDGRWSVNARVYSGGRGPDTADLDTVALAANGGEIAHPNGRKPRTRKGAQ